MTARHWTILLGVVSILFIAGYLYFVEEEQGYETSRALRYSVSIQNTTGEPVKNAKVWVFGPVKKTSFQHVTSISASQDFKLLDDAMGNQVLEFDLLSLAPYATKIINIKATMLLSTTPQRVETDFQGDGFLADERYIETNHPMIIQKAKALATAGDAAESSRRIFTWVNRHIKYTGFVKEDQGALYALKNAMGDCTEYMYLFTALNRATGKKTRAVGGYVVEEDSVLAARDYHNWAEVEQNGVWRVADVQNNVYMDKEHTYIVFRIINRNHQHPLTNTHRLAYSDERLNVSMD